MVGGPVFDPEASPSRTLGGFVRPALFEGLELISRTTDRLLAGFSHQHRPEYYMKVLFAAALAEPPPMRSCKTLSSASGSERKELAVGALVPWTDHRVIPSIGC